MAAEAQLDVDALYGALDQKRKRLDISWRQVAVAAAVSPSTFTRMKDGKRPDVDSFARLVEWLGVSADKFLLPVQGRRTKKPPETMSEISAFLRASKDLSPRSVEALEDIIRAAYERLRNE